MTVKPTELEPGDVIERPAEMFGAGAGTHVRQVTVIELRDNNVVVSAKHKDRTETVSKEEIATHWFTPDERHAGTDK